MARPRTISDEEILDRALPLMTRAGPGGFKLAELAKELGIAPATLVQRFGDKQTLVERAFALDNERFVEWLSQLPPETGVDAVIAIYCDAAALFGETSSLADHLLWLREDILDPVLNRLAHARFALFRAEIVKRLPEMRLPPDTVARLLDAQFHGAVVQWALDPQGRFADFLRGSLRDWFRLGGV
jgi:AcrR family transcriptional regulator